VRSLDRIRARVNSRGADLHRGTNDPVGSRKDPDRINSIENIETLVAPDAPLFSQLLVRNETLELEKSWGIKSRERR